MVKQHLDQYLSQQKQPHFSCRPSQLHVALSRLWKHSCAPQTCPLSHTHTQPHSVSANGCSGISQPRYGHYLSNNVIMQFSCLLFLFRFCLPPSRCCCCCCGNHEEDLHWLLPAQSLTSPTPYKGRWSVERGRIDPCAEAENAPAISAWRKANDGFGTVGSMSAQPPLLTLWLLGVFRRRYGTASPLRLTRYQTPYFRLVSN